MNHKFLMYVRKSTCVAIAAGTLSFGAGAVRADLAKVRVISGETTQAEGALTATTRTMVELPVAANDDSIVVRGLTGTRVNEKGIQIGGMSLVFLGADGKVAVGLDGKPVPGLDLRAADLKLYGDSTVYPDAIIQMNFPLRYYVRPNVALYSKGAKEAAFKKWESFPKASEHAFTVEFRRAADGKLQLWFDGNFMSWYPAVAISKLRVVLEPGATLQGASASQSTQAALQPLPVQLHARTQGMENPQIMLDSKPALPDVFSKAKDLSTGIAIDGLGLISTGSDDLQSFYFRRSALDNLPEQRIFTVPLATYDSAYVLCAAEDDPEKLNAFTLRVTRYGRARGNAMADTIVELPAAAAKDTSDARRVGTVEYGATGARKKATLWLLKVPIKNGQIQDLLTNDDKRNNSMGTADYLDVELLSPLPGAEVAQAFPPPMEVTGRAYSPTIPDYAGYDFYNTVAPTLSSNVHVFGLALQKSPAQMRVASNIGIQEFYTSDKPQFDAEVSADKAGSYAVKWEYADVDGKIVGQGTKSVTLKAGEKSTLSAPVNQGNGWYAARFVLSQGSDQLVDYHTSFVMLPPDTRQAGLESPFYGWWYGSSHGSDIKLDEIGPILKRLGIRRVGLPDNMPESETLPKYGFTDSTVNWTQKDLGSQMMRAYMSGTKTLPEAIATQEAAIREILKKWPSIDRMLVFHESGAAGAPFPSELWDETPAPPKDAAAAEKVKVTWDKRIEYLTAMAKMVRKEFPQLKMHYGNDGSSVNLLGELFRRKFPREYIDAIASEGLGQTIAPERDTLGGVQDAWYLRELAGKMGYYGVPVTATTEWIGRMTEKLGNRAQAEWKARDGVLALAYGYDTISIAGISDASDAYYYSIWANGGLNTRYPLMAPKPAYAAVATLTQVMDKVKFSRMVETGSTVCYVAEFQRGNEWVYALWTPRGERALNVTFADDASRTLTDLYGRSSELRGKSTPLQASTAMQYLVSKTKLTSAVAGQSTFVADNADVPKPLQEVNWSSAEELKVVPEPKRAGGGDIAYSSPRVLVEGKAIVREVTDAEMGKCLEIEFQPDENLHLGQIEFVTLNLTTPIKTTAQNAGLWVKGNGSWGAIDLIKNHWGPWADSGNLNMSWSGKATMNFDGWNLIQYPYYDWVHTKGVYASTIINGLRITIPRTTLVGTDRVPVKSQTIRIKGVVLF